MYSTYRVINLPIEGVCWEGHRYYGSSKNVITQRQIEVVADASYIAGSHHAEEGREKNSSGGA